MYNHHNKHSSLFRGNLRFGLDRASMSIHHKLMELYNLIPFGDKLVLVRTFSPETAIELSDSPNISDVTMLAEFFPINEIRSKGLKVITPGILLEEVCDEWDGEMNLYMFPEGLTLLETFIIPEPEEKYLIIEKNDDDDDGPIWLPNYDTRKTGPEVNIQFGQDAIEIIQDQYEYCLRVNRSIYI